MKRKSVEWRETRPEYTTKRDFTLFVRNRYAFFGCASPRKWRAALNFAANFAEENRICLLYVFGTPRGGISALKKAAASFSGHIVCAVYPDIDDDLTAIDKYSALCKRLKKEGFFDADNNETAIYSETREKVYRLVLGHKIPRDEPLYLQYKSERRIIKRYRRALANIAEVQEKPAVCVSNFTKRIAIIPDEKTLTDIARNLFPFGVEADTDDERAVKITSAKRCINKAIEGDFSQLGIVLRGEVEQYTLFDDFTKGASELVEYAKNFCRERQRDKGCFYLAELWSILKMPPFGAYDCNWYLYLFAVITREYFTDKYRWLMNIVSVSGNDHDPVFALTKRNSSFIIYIEDENNVKLAGLVSRLFDIPEKLPYYIYSPHKHLDVAIMKARSWCVENVQTPLAWIDDRFRELFRADENEWCKRGAADKFVTWIESNFDDLYQRIRTVDADFDSSIIPKYGEERVKLWRKHYYVKGGAVGWLHSAENFTERLVDYMEKYVTCRECGRIISDDKLPGGHDEQVITESGEELNFTPKDIIGANKKFLGRYQNEFFCLNCLCEVLDCTPERLHERIHFFKESGCTLF